MMTMNMLAKRAGLVVFGLVAGVVLGPANPASAQSTLVNPDTLSDLTVNVNAPGIVGREDVTQVAIRVDNVPPAIPVFYRYAFVPTSAVKLLVDLTGLVPQAVQPVVTRGGNLICNFGNLGGEEDWYLVGCNGSLPIGGAATINVSVKPKSGWHCLRPTYVDARVLIRSPERTTSNNRTVAAMDLLPPAGTLCEYPF